LKNWRRSAARRVTSSRQVSQNVPPDRAIVPSSLAASDIDRSSGSHQPSSACPETARRRRIRSGSIAPCSTRCDPVIKLEGQEPTTTQTMNSKLKTALLAIAGAALATQQAGAYADGDLILGVRLQNNTGNNYEVNLGTFANYDNLDGSTFFLPQVSTSDLSSIFGAGWINGTSGGQNLRWG